jgi:hypothetical protein
MPWRAITLITLTGVVLGCLWAVSASAQTPLPLTLATVQRAKNILQEQVNEESKLPLAKRPIVNSRNAALNVSLAAWNEQTDEVIIIELTKQAKKATVKSPAGLTVKVLRDNGVNSEFEIVGRPELHVLALKHPIFTDIGTAKRPRFRLENAAYVPYSDFLATPEIVAAGAEYLNSNVQAVYDELTALGVRSKAFPDRSLAQAIEPNLVKAIIAIEHVSAASLLNGELKDYLKVFYVILAGNRHQAYAYSRSTASARGLVQFIPSTYNRLVKSRPDLTLVKNFEQGMTDPYNAIKAELALLDYNLTLLPSAVRQQHISDERTIGAYSAAIYNGGSTRVRRSIARWGDSWAKDHAADLSAFKKSSQTLTTEVSRLKKALTSKKLTTKDKAGLNAKLKTAQAELAKAKTNYASGLNTSLKSETVKYVAKYYLAYDYFSQPSGPLQ